MALQDTAGTAGLRALGERVRATTFDAWLFALMLAWTSVAVSAGLYVSYTALRYVAEEIGGMPPTVSIAFPLTIDAAVAAGLFGEWWLAGRRQREQLAFGYMLVFGLVFAGLTVGGNALHGALALSVQRPVELHIGGQLVPLPWWISIAVSAVPGLAIAGAGTALSLVVAAWRRERSQGVEANAASPAAGVVETEPPALRQELERLQAELAEVRALSAGLREVVAPALQAAAETTAHVAGDDRTASRESVALPAIERPFGPAGKAPVAVTGVVTSNVGDDDRDLAAPTSPNGHGMTLTAVAPRPLDWDGAGPAVAAVLTEPGTPGGPHKVVGPATAPPVDGPAGDPESDLTTATPHMLQSSLVAGDPSADEQGQKHVVGGLAQALQASPRAAQGEAIPPESPTHARLRALGWGGPDIPEPETGAADHQPVAMPGQATEPLADDGVDLGSASGGDTKRPSSDRARPMVAADSGSCSVTAQSAPAMGETAAEGSATGTAVMTAASGGVDRQGTTRAAANGRGPGMGATAPQPPGTAIAGREAATAMQGWVASEGRPSGHAGGHAVAGIPVTSPATAGRAGGDEDDRGPVAVMTAEEAKAAAVRLVRQARRSGRRVTAADVQRVTGRKARQARRLLAQAVAAVREDTTARRPRVLDGAAGAATTAREA